MKKLSNNLININKGLNDKKRYNKNEYLYLILLILIVITLTILFFKEGLFIASQEAGLWLYNPENFFNMGAFTWREIATGELSNTGITAIPYLLILLTLYDFIKVPFYLEVFFFLVYLLAGTISSFLLVKYIIGKNNAVSPSIINQASFLASVFYLFNLHTIMCMFNRFQYSFMMFWGFFPIVFYYFIRWMNEGKFKQLVLSNIFCTLFLSFSFITPAFISDFILMISLFFLTQFFMRLLQHKTSLALRTLKLFVAYCISWLIFNFWWILPTGYIATSTSELSLFNLQLNLDLLKAGSLWISSIFNSIRLFYSSYFSGVYWGREYFTPLMTFLTIVPSIVATIGLLFEETKDEDILTCFLIWLMLIFLSKGVLEPFGNVYETLFRHLIIFQTLRYPFEKIGFILTIIYSILLGYSTATLLKYVKDRSVRNIILIILIILILVPAYPVFNGTVLTKNVGSTVISYKVDVPSYYTRLNDFLKKDDSEFRIVGLPIKHFGSQAIYNWSTRYFGYCPLQVLINKPVISFILYSTIFPFTDPIVYKTEEILVERCSLKSLSLLNVKYLVLQNDMNKDSGKYSQQKIYNVLQFLNNSGKIQQVDTFGQLDLYKISDDYFLPRLYTSNKFTLINDINSMFKLFEKEYYDPRETVTFTVKHLDMERIDFLANLPEFKKYYTITKIKPLAIDLTGFKLENVPKGSIEKVYYQNNTLIWYVEVNNDEKIDKYSIIKTFKKPLDLSEYDYFVLDIYSTSPLIEINFVEDLNGSGGGSGKYAYKIVELIPNKWNRVVIFKDELKYVGGEINWTNVNRLRFYIADDKGWGGIGVLEQNIYKIKSLRAYKYPNVAIPLKNKTEINVSLQDFYVDSNPHNASKLYYDSDNNSLLWNVNILGNESNIYTITKIYEADLSNLDKIELEVFSNAKYLEINFVRDLYGKGGGNGEYAWYKFELQPNKWNKIVISKEKFHYVNFDERKWKDINRIRFYIAYPSWGIENKNITFIIKNFKIILTNHKEFSVILNNKPPYHPAIIFKKVNPTKYIVSVENATKPFFLVFSESYHPQWKIYIEDKPTEFDKIVAEYPQVHVKEAKHDWYKFTPEDIVFLLKKPAVNETLHFKANGYANAWYIDPKEFDKDGDGKFTIIIYFLPQSLFYLGLFISGTTLLCCIGYLFYDWKKHTNLDLISRAKKLLKVG